MREFTAVFAASFKYLWRDIVSVLVLTVFPILLILVLGTALASFISPDYDFEPLPVSASVQAGGNFEAFLQSDDISRFLDVTFTDSEAAERLLESREVFVAVIEEDGNISVIRPQVGGLHVQIPLSIIDSYLQIGAAMTISIMNGGDIAELAGLTEADISVISAPLGNRTQSAVDYYAVTMMVMLMMFAGLNGLELFKKSMFSQTGARMLIAPVSKPVLISGLIAASTVTSYLQAMVTFLFSTFVYGVHWGDNIPLILLTLFGVTLFSQAFAIFLLLFFKNANAAQGSMQVLIFLTTFVAGGFNKMNFGAAEAVFRYSPNSLAHTIIFGSAFGGNHERMMSDLRLLFIYAAVLFAGAFLLGKRRLTS
jgi:ABC-2 type transport system permease protein